MKTELPRVIKGSNAVTEGIGVRIGGRVYVVSTGQLHVYEIQDSDDLEFLYKV